MLIEHGIVGNDGETHQGIFDMAFFSLIPNITIMAPKNFEELEKMLEFAIELKKPVVIRYPRGGEGNIKFDKCQDIELGKSELIKEGKDVTIIAIGKMVERAMQVAEKLAKNEIDAEVINARFLKPLDDKTIESSINNTKNVITIEDGILRGGLATSIIELLKKLKLDDVKIQNYGYNDEFVQHGSVDELEKIHGLDSESIKLKILEGMLWQIL